MKIGVALAALTLGSLVVGCGGESVARTARVEISRDSAVGYYNPEDVTVREGGTVSWTNKSGVVHDVTFDDANITSSDLFRDGESFETTFEQEGLYRYTCTIHPTMVGTVRVVAAST